MTDFNSLVMADSGWVLQNATGINDTGLIVGSGTLNGAVHEFLLTPAGIPEPATAAVWAGFGGLVLAAGWRRWQI
jgi:hypothetical protein